MLGRGVRCALRDARLRCAVRALSLLGRGVRCLLHDAPQRCALRAPNCSVAVSDARCALQDARPSAVRDARSTMLGRGSRCELHDARPHHPLMASDVGSLGTITRTSEAMSRHPKRPRASAPDVGSFEPTNGASKRWNFQTCAVRASRCPAAVRGARSTMLGRGARCAPRA